MSVEYYPCDKCGTTICDCGPYTTCSNCEAELCTECAEEQLKKYGYTKDEEKVMCYGDEALVECDLCSKKTLDSRIAKKKQELKELEEEKNDKKN